MTDATPGEFSPLIRDAFGLAIGSEFGRSLIEPGGFFEVSEEDVLGEPMAVFKNRMRSTIELLTTSAANAPDREYLIDDDRRLTYAEAVDAVARLSKILIDEYGITPGAHVGLFAANSIEWVLSFWAITASGAVVSAMNSYWSAPETSAAIDLTAPVVVLADTRRAGILTQVSHATPVLLLDPALYSRLTDGSSATLPGIRSDEDDPALLMFTSGTTGMPKGVVHRHRTAVGLYHCAIFNSLLRIGDFPTAVPDPPRILVGPPFFHLSALFGSIVMYTATGGALVLRPGRFDEERTLKAIQDERVSHWLSVGSAAPRVASHPKLQDYDLSSLQMVLVGGAPMTPSVREFLMSAFPGGDENVRMGYTSTEAGVGLATIAGTDFRDEPDSTGPVQDGVQIAILDPTGQPVGPANDGVVHVRSPYTMVGYLDNDEASRDAYRDGRWLSMGDVGRLENGLLYLNSRARDLIFVSSENVYPSEVENRLESHPDVIESCVAGVDDPTTGQAVKAYIVLTPGSSATIEDLSAHCQGGLPPYKVPTSWEIRVERLPRNATGKILRSALAADS